MFSLFQINIPLWDVKALFPCYAHSLQSHVISPNHLFSVFITALQPHLWEYFPSDHFAVLLSGFSLLHLDGAKGHINFIFLKFFFLVKFHPALASTNCGEALTKHDSHAEADLAVFDFRMVFAVVLESAIV